MYKEMKKIPSISQQSSVYVEFGNGDEFLDFADIFFFGIKNVMVGGRILGSVDRKYTYIYFWPNIKREGFQCKNVNIGLLLCECFFWRELGF